MLLFLIMTLFFLIFIIFLKDNKEIFKNQALDNKNKTLFSDTLEDNSSVKEEMIVLDSGEVSGNYPETETPCSKEEVIFVRDYKDNTFSHEKVFTNNKNFLSKEEEENIIKHALITLAAGSKPELCIKVKSDCVRDRFHPESILDSIESE